MRYLTLSDLMDYYEDNELDLPDAGITDPRRVERLVRGRLGGDAAPRRTPRRVLTLFIAAAALLAMSATAYAVYQRSLADRVLEGGVTMTAQDGSVIVQYSAVGVNAPESAAPAPETTGAEQYVAYVDEKGTSYSAVGKNAEYEALKEWTAFSHGNDCPLEARDLLDYSDPHRLVYGVGYGVLAEELDNIARRYGLRLLRSATLLDTEQELFDTLALERFYPAPEGDRSHVISVYDDGSFQASGMLMAGPEGDDLGFNMYRAVRGSFTDFLLLGGDPALADFETYAAADGTEVDIALEDSGAFLFADTENCHVTFALYDGREAGMTMARLEAVADSVDFAALDRVDTAAVAANVEAGMARNREENPDHYRDVADSVRRVYEELGDYALDGLLPEGWKRTVSYAGDVDGAARFLESVDGDITPGPADYYDAVSVSYGRTEEDGAAPAQELTLTYERYWGDRDQAVIRNAQAFKNRRVTAVTVPGSYFGEEYLVLCPAGGFEGYYSLYGSYGGRYGAWGISITWHDTDKELLFTLSLPSGFSVADAFALADSFAASIRDIPGPAPTGVVSDEVEEDLSYGSSAGPVRGADVSALGRFSLTPPEGFAPAGFFSAADQGGRMRAVQTYTNGGDPLAGYDRLLLSWERDTGDENSMAADFATRRDLYRSQRDDPAYADTDIICVDCTVNGFEGFVCQDSADAGPSVRWLDTERDLLFTLQADNTLTYESAAFDADALLSLARTVQAE